MLSTIIIRVISFLLTLENLTSAFSKVKVSAGEIKSFDRIINFTAAVDAKWSRKNNYECITK